jgi:hypothetical protein
MSRAKWQVFAEMFQSQFQIGKCAPSQVVDHSESINFRIADKPAIADEKRV